MQIQWAPASFLSSPYFSSRTNIGFERCLSREIETFSAAVSFFPLIFLFPVTTHARANLAVPDQLFVVAPFFFFPLTLSPFFGRRRRDAAFDVDRRDPRAPVFSLFPASFPSRHPPRDGSSARPVLSGRARAAAISTAFFLFFPFPQPQP